MKWFAKTTTTEFSRCQFRQEWYYESVPGDIIRTHCVYDDGRWNFNKHGGKAVSKDFVTEYGEGTYKEMCFNFIMYYPRKDGFNFCVGRNGGGPSIIQRRRFGLSPSRSSTAHVHDHGRAATSVGDALAHAAGEEFQRQLRDIPASIAASIDTDAISTVDDAAGARRAREVRGWPPQRGQCPKFLQESCAQAAFCFGSVACDKDVLGR